MSPREEKRFRNKIREGLQSDEAMIRFMDNLFGRDNCVYDPEVDAWVARDKDHSGPGRSFIMVQRGGLWRKIILSGSVLQ
jgi:hypothetical protein